MQSKFAIRLQALAKFLFDRFQDDWLRRSFISKQANDICSFLTYICFRIAFKAAHKQRHNGIMLGSKNTYCFYSRFTNGREPPPN